MFYVLEKRFQLSREASTHGYYVVSSILFDVSMPKCPKMRKRLTHEPAAEREEQRVNCSPSNQDTEIQPYSRV